MSYILIVDDDHNMGQTLSDMVGLFDWNTQIVTSPRAAIESLHRNPPALILLDLNMPGVDGMEVCRYIKRDPITGSTPVVFVTAEDDPGTRERAKEAGALDYLIKPVDIDRLEGILEKLPTKPGQIISLPAAKPSSTPAATTTPTQPSTPKPTPTQPSSLLKSAAPSAPAGIPAPAASPQPPAQNAPNTQPSPASKPADAAPSTPEKKP